jgi:siroheme synthase (precorrin-2 oxidase/ferrochelatase)
MSVPAVSRRPPGRVRVLEMPGQSRRVLVVGGGIQAAWLVGELSRTDHPITVVATRICDDLLDMLVEHRYEWISHDPRPADLKGVWLVHAATGDDEQDARVCSWVDVSRRRLALADAS